MDIMGIYMNIPYNGYINPCYLMDYDGFMAMFLPIKHIDHGVSEEFITPTPYIYNNDNN
jgi:hypothetical protein